MEITTEIKIFRNFLLSNWTTVEIFSSKTSKKETAINDFIQGNWELLVEASFDVFLPSFGEGADMNGISSRVTYPDKEPTHYITCKLKQTSECLYTGEVQDDLSGFYFKKFVDDSFEVSPPMDYVYLINVKQERRIISYEDVSFFLQKL